MHPQEPCASTGNEEESYLNQYDQFSVYEELCSISTVIYLTIIWNMSR